jgi:branched-chain amino acid transport system ATP-binding protein
LLEVEGLIAGYGKVTAIRGVSLNVEGGEIVALIGPNGAGKTTTMKTIIGLIRPNAGTITYQGRPIQGRPAHRIVKMGISLVPEGRRIFPTFTVRQNLEIGATARNDPHEIGKDFERALQVFPALKTRLNQRGGTLSGGELQMLAVGRALMSRPKMLLLDEPSLGLAPLVAEGVLKTLREINREGTTLLLVEQNANLALEVSSRAYVMEAGEIMINGASNELKRNEMVRRVYLGLANTEPY